MKLTATVEVVCSEQPHIPRHDKDLELVLLEEGRLLSSENARSSARDELQSVKVEVIPKQEWVCDRRSRPHRYPQWVKFEDRQTAPYRRIPTVSPHRWLREVHDEGRPRLTLSEENRKRLTPVAFVLSEITIIVVALVVYFYADTFDISGPFSALTGIFVLVALQIMLACYIVHWMVSTRERHQHEHAI